MNMDNQMKAWDGVALDELLALEKVDEFVWRTHLIDMNLNGRAYGGQTLGQAMAAACASAPADRTATAMQLMFLAGVRPDAPVDFHVRPLQDGKRFSSRHVSASQGGRLVADAQVAFQIPSPGLQHQVDINPIERDPLAGVLLSAMPREWDAKLRRISGFSLTESSCLEFRVPDPERQLFNPASSHRMEFWLRVCKPFPASSHWRAAAFAYASDWWLNFTSAGGHLGRMAHGTALYGASLNHNLWLYADFDPSEWMLFASHSVCTRGGRGLSIAQIYDQSFTLCAVASQECLMTEVLG